MEQLGARHILVQLDRETLAETEGRIVSWRVVEGM